MGGISLKRGLWKYVVICPWHTEAIFKGLVQTFQWGKVRVRKPILKNAQNNLSKCYKHAYNYEVKAGDAWDNNHKDSLTSYKSKIGRVGHMDLRITVSCGGSYPWWDAIAIELSQVMSDNFTHILLGSASIPYPPMMIIASTTSLAHQDVFWHVSTNYSPGFWRFWKTVLQGYQELGMCMVFNWLQHLVLWRSYCQMLTKLNKNT